jgi:hypothetical protein
MSDDDLTRTVERVEQDGKSRFGDAWGQYISAIGKVHGGHPKLGEAMREVLSQADPAAVIAQSGRESLIALADSDDEANRSYSEIRQRERDHYRLMKGRGPR